MRSCGSLREPHHKQCNVTLRDQSNRGAGGAVAQRLLLVADLVPRGDSARSSDCLFPSTSVSRFLTCCLFALRCRTRPRLDRHAELSSPDLPLVQPLVVKLHIPRDSSRQLDLPIGHLRSQLRAQYCEYLTFSSERHSCARIFDRANFREDLLHDTYAQAVWTFSSLCFLNSPSEAAALLALRIRALVVNNAIFSFLLNCLVGLQSHAARRRQENQYISR